MAKKSKIARDAQRRQIVTRHAARRQELKAAAIDPTLSTEQRQAALEACCVSSAYSLIRLRELAHAGHLPGVTKSSW
jgi:small subunit ribosomal protein S14